MSDGITDSAREMEATNKLLARYLGKEVREFTWKHETMLISKNCDPIIDTRIIWSDVVWTPNSKWNQLMRVVEKIEEEKTQVEIVGRECSIFDMDAPYAYSHRENMMAHDIGTTKIQAVYNACVEYIKTKKK